MTTLTPNRNQIRRSYIAVAGLLVSVAIAFLAVAVVQDLRELESAHSDNVQWTISQSEVEFLEFSKQLNGIEAGTAAELTNLRRRFDIFYSRIATLESASIYRPLQEYAEYEAAISTIRQFLDASVPLIDADDQTLKDGIPNLLAASDEVRSSVRSISNSSLEFFAQAADQRRQNFAETLVKLAVAVVLLVLALGFTVNNLRRLNVQKTQQQHDAAEAARRMDTVIQTSLDGVIVADEDGKILAFNSAAETIFGHVASDVLGKELGPLIVPDHMVEAHDAGMERMRNNGEKHVVGKGRVSLEAKHSNGSIFPVELAIQSAETEKGVIFIAFLRDISARVAAEKDLIEARDQALAADRLKTEFLATMSHEIRTPLNGLLGNLMLIQDTKLNPQQTRYIANMTTSGELLLQHVTDVLDLSRYDVGKLKLKEVPVNLSHLVQSIVDSQIGLAAQNDTSFEWHWIGEPRNWVLSDSGALQHILMNLVGNALKFTQHGRVSITLQAEDIADGFSDFTIHVSDTGQGMDDDLKSRIFDDFVTGTVAYDRNVGGTGLGLGIVRRSVNALGGTIEVESTPDVGSTFEVRIKLKRAQPNLDAAARPQRPEIAAGLRVLIVEDNEINAAVLREMLQADGHLTTEVHDGAAAVEIAETTAFDLILMDISMPVMDGRTATRAIRNGTGLCANTPILAVTANAMETERAAFLQDGMNGIVIKPLSRRDLREELHSVAAKMIRQEVSRDSVAHQNEMRDVLGDDAFSKIKARFVAEAEELHQWLGEVPIPALHEITARCHKMAGGAAVLGASDYQAKLNAIEDAAKANDVNLVAAGIASLPRVWEETKRAL